MNERIYTGYIEPDDITALREAKRETTALRVALGDDTALNLITENVDLTLGWREIAQGLRILRLQHINPNRAVGISALAGLVADGAASSSIPE